MNPRRLFLSPLNISEKLTLICVATTAVALACVLTAFVVQDFRVVKRAKTEQTQTDLATLADQVAALVHANTLTPLPKLLSESSKEHGIVTAVVLAPNGNILAGHPNTIDSLQNFYAQANLDHRRQFGHVVYQSVLNWQGQAQGTLLVGVNNTDVEMRLYYMLEYAIWAFLLAIALAFLVGGCVQRIVSAPLKSLQKLSQNIIDSGDYSLRAPVASQDELGQLSVAVNRMLAQIEQRDTMLEKQVDQRTAELQKMAEEFRFRALHDTLTGLPNRALLVEEYPRILAHAQRVGKVFAVLLLDLDNFKNINDTYGHDLGDELLKQVASRIRGGLRGEDLFCRLGGDEFVVLVQDVDSVEDVRRVGHNLLQALLADICLSERCLHISVSIGASIYPAHGEDLTELKRNADIAMYRAKEAGKNQLMLFDRRMEQQAIFRMLVQNDLRDAIFQDDLELYFQPQIDPRQQKLCGCEVLVRWHHPKAGLLLPGDFIPHAESNGLVRNLDYFVLRKACITAQRWRRELGLTVPIAVNFSGIHFRCNAIVATIQETLSQTGWPAELLTVELTEAVMIDAPETARNVVNTIRKLGVKIALDDFGVGYSSLHYLRTLVVDEVKLDRSFTMDVHHDEKERRLVKGIASLTRDFAVALVAEGIECAAQAEVMQAIGCHILQGYFYAPPKPEAEFIAWAKAFNEQHYLELA